MVGVGDGNGDKVGVGFGGSSGGAVGTGVGVGVGVAVGVTVLLGVGVGPAIWSMLLCGFGIFASAMPETTNATASTIGKLFLIITTSVLREYRGGLDAMTVPQVALITLI